MHFSIPEPYRTAIAFLAVLGILIFIHEMGHYLAARWRGVYVEKFAVGFGKHIVAWHDKRGTQWSIGWIPLGGYVKLHGHEGLLSNIPDSIKASWKPGQTFYDKSVLDRSIIVLAGPMANFLLAAFLFSGLFATMGKPYAQAVINTVVENSPAQVAGFMPNDRIISIDDHVVVRFDQLQEAIKTHQSTPIKMTVDRNGLQVNLSVTPEIKVMHGRETPFMGISYHDSLQKTLEIRETPFMGISGGKLGFEPMSTSESLVQGTVFTGESAIKVLSAMGEFVTGTRGTNELGGPIKIAQMSGEVAADGLVAFISFIAFMSINLGLMNLLPVPVLDGGYLLFYLFEAIRGKPLPVRVIEAGMKIGFAAMMGLMVFTTFNDLKNTGFFIWFTSLIG